MAMNRQQRRDYVKQFNTPRKIESYASQLERKIKQECEEYYHNKYQEDLANSIDIFIVTIVYALHNNEKTRFGKARIDDFMKDLFVSVDMFNRGEYNVNDYIKELKEDGIPVINNKGEIVDEFE